MKSRGSELVIKPLGPMAAALTQMFQAPRTDIRGVTTQAWFGPLQPVKPIAPPDTEPRGFQYPSGANLNFTPRSNLPLNFTQLREASMFDLVRVIIENVKDQICRMPVNIRLRRQPGENAKEYARRKADQGIVNAISERVENPNPNENRSEFTRKLLDDMLVIDAASVLFRTTKSGELMELRAIDGASICRYIDEQGYTPLPPSPAYAQLWYGTPMVDLTSNQLLYAARNVPTYRLYGMSPTEQAINWILLGVKRLESQTRFYTEGSIPDAIQIVPPNISPDKIAEAQTWMVSDLAGMLGKKHQLRLIQGFAPDGKDQVLFPKEEMLSDPMDDLIIRYVCFAFGTSPQRLMRMMNRATAQAADSSAEKEGLEPWMDWMAGAVWNRIIQQKLGFTDYELTFEEDTDVDPLKQAQISEINLKVGKITINEARETDGIEPSNVPEADMLMVMTATGPVPVSAEADTARAKLKSDAMPKPEPQPLGGGGPAAPAKEPDQKKTLKLGKAGKISIDASQLTPGATTAKVRMGQTLIDLFAKQKSLAIKAAESSMKVRKKEKTPDELSQEIYDAVAQEYSSIVETISLDLEQAGTSGVHHGAGQVGVTDTPMIEAANNVAADYARDRAAELVGMRRTPDGGLVENPNAEWAISTTTRDEIRTIVTDAFKEETPLSRIIEEIKQAGTFSDARANMIAKTEVQTAQSNGNLEVWRASGAVTKLKWLLSADHEIECVCDDNEDVEVEFGQLFPSGDFVPPAHPRCECVVIAVGFAE